jgi:hypothetical protein
MFLGQNPMVVWSSLLTLWSRHIQIELFYSEPPGMLADYWYPHMPLWQNLSPQDQSLGWCNVFPCRPDELLIYLQKLVHSGKLIATDFPLSLHKTAYIHLKFTPKSLTDQSVRVTKRRVIKFHNFQYVECLVSCKINTLFLYLFCVFNKPQGSWSVFTCWPVDLLVFFRENAEFIWHFWRNEVYFHKINTLNMNKSERSWYQKMRNSIMQLSIPSTPNSKQTSTII